MRFSKEEKLQIYQLYKAGYSYLEIYQLYPISGGNFYHLTRVLDCHGVAWLNRPYHHWTIEEKREAIDRVLLNHESRSQVSIDLGLSSVGMLTNWIHDFQKNGYNVVKKRKGRPRNMTKNSQKKNKSAAEKLKELEKELLYLKAENAYLKGLRELTAQKQKKQK